jgi:hypothetical protein
VVALLIYRTAAGEVLIPHPSFLLCNDSISLENLNLLYRFISLFGVFVYYFLYHPSSIICCLFHCKLCRHHFQPVLAAARIQFDPTTMAPITSPPPLPSLPLCLCHCPQRFRLTFNQPSPSPPLLLRIREEEGLHLIVTSQQRPCCMEVQLLRYLPESQVAAALTGAVVGLLQLQLICHLLLCPCTGGLSISCPRQRLSLA